MSQTAQFLEQAKAAVQCALTLDEIDSIRVKFLGRKGVFTVQLKELGKLPAVERPAAGQVINEAKHQLMSAIRVRQQELERERIQVALTAEALDVALPGRGQLGGSIHPITRTIRRMQRIFVKAGFEVLTEAGYQPESAYFEVLHELKLIVDLIYQGGLEGMRYSVSTTAEYGDYTVGPKIIDDSVKQSMKNVLDDIQSGRFAREWIAENDEGLHKYNELREADLSHPVEKIGKDLRAMMPWLESTT